MIQAATGKRWREKRRGDTWKHRQVKHNFFSSILYQLRRLHGYIRYSAICARVVRAALKPELKAEAQKSAEANVKITKLKTA
ncbi:ATP synthase, H+ transporting, mitochondrial F1 complex, epsilon subunit-like [Scleropages formosus]|uniref:ATP synthase, H+ transporting, mitochondrial F1 complex, epsilon subunit-like n=1 Tax=Scleropages formosus TaxID=113540 RepID=A0A0P7W7K9_SCLFO|nr:ATP synthase, H+ transporting, mitochondrial F1 complex, epsilon subunit-like [Scleropages formosus]